MLYLYKHFQFGGAKRVTQQQIKGNTTDGWVDGSGHRLLMFPCVTTYKQYLQVWYMTAYIYRKSSQEKNYPTKFSNQKTMLRLSNKYYEVTLSLTEGGQSEVELMAINAWYSNFRSFKWVDS